MTNVDLIHLSGAGIPADLTIKDAPGLPVRAPDRLS